MADRKLSQTEIEDLHEQFLQDFIVYFNGPKSQPTDLPIEQDYATFNKMTGSNFTKETATESKLRKAHQKASLKLHPDKGGNTEDFQKMNAAYKKIVTSLENPEALPSEDINFDQLLTRIITNINKIKDKQIATEKPLRDLAIKNLPKSLSELKSSVISLGIPIENSDGTTTYVKNNSSVTVNNQGNIISMSN